MTASPSRFVNTFEKPNRAWLKLSYLLQGNRHSIDEIQSRALKTWSVDLDYSEYKIGGLCILILIEAILDGELLSTPRSGRNIE